MDSMVGIGVELTPWLEWNGLHGWYWSGVDSMVGVEHSLID
jgi:hypothetical protein